MLPRPTHVFFLCLVVTAAISSGKPQNSSGKQTDTAKSQAGQSLVVNNNCGLANNERQMMAHIKAKVDYIAAQSDKETRCSTGWVRFGQSCYLVIDIPTLQWSDARRNCQKLGGDLAKITSAAENQFIYDLLTRQKKVMSYGAWLGLHRKANSKFYWADDTPLTGYTAWASREPSSPSSEKCGHIYALGSSKGKWNDWLCSLFKSDITRAPVVLCQKHSK